MEKVLVLDNYDSFTFNLVHYIEAEGNFEAAVFRNDDIDLPEVAAFDRIVLSPGPGLPGEAGILTSLLSRYAAEKKILGVCLGQQAIGTVFGGKLKNLKQVLHGVSTGIRIIDEEDALFRDVPASFSIGRYHSWVLDPDHLPAELKIIAEDESGEIMAIRHKSFDLCGVQFHPESVLTGYGYRIIQNWLNS